MLEDPRAVSAAEDALRRYRSLESRRVEIEARMLEHLATCLARQEDFTRARACYEEALQVAGPVLDLARLARIYHGWAAATPAWATCRRGSTTSRGPSRCTRWSTTSGRDDADRAAQGRERPRHPAARGRPALQPGGGPSSLRPCDPLDEASSSGHAEPLPPQHPALHSWTPSSSRVPRSFSTLGIARSASSPAGGRAPPRTARRTARRSRSLRMSPQAGVAAAQAVIDAASRARSSTGPGHLQRLS